MGVLKTFGSAIFLTCLATAAKPDEHLLRQVTNCVGKLSAQIEHHWLMSDKATDEIETRRAHLVDILDAIVSPDRAKDVLAKRIDAKQAHASLLAQATFSKDDRRAAWAEKRATLDSALCATLLLPPVPDGPSQSESTHISGVDSLNQEAWNASQQDVPVR